MAHVFVSNGSYQHVQFLYRIPEAVDTRVLNIPAGGQAKFPEDLEGAHLDAIVKQLEKFGALRSSEAGKIHIPRTLTYKVEASQGKPITSKEIDAARVAEEKARHDVTVEQLEAAGIAASEIAAKSAPPGSVGAVSIDVEEVTDLGKVSGGVDTTVIVKRGESAPRGRTRRK